ncbi:MAG: ATP-binding protein [Clostridia bacterium]|nr:ATP-binding protein [Clostridia bacterium]MBQ1554373.1 ATP-binding protein [Clostridia bacterium]
MFIGRKEELAFLEERYQRDRAELVVLYGRRRIGKTELLIEFCKNKPNFFYACNEYTDSKQLTAFWEGLLSFSPALLRYKQRADDWADVFATLARLSGEQKTVVVIDEFPYMCRGNNSIPSVLQNIWDHTLKDANLMLILCGSSMSFMEDEILAAKNPLYGRTTGIYKLEPMPFADAIQFFPDYSPEDQLISYAILGGIPHYLKQFDPRVSVETNIKKQILTKGTVLFGEVEYILHQELRDPAVYITLIETIATGSTKFNEICTRSQIESGKAVSYLKNLMELGIVTREFPLLTSAKDRLKRNQGEYHMADDFFRFWFAYAYRYMSELSKGDVDDIWEYVIQDNLHDFSSKAFENVCIDYLRQQKRRGNTPFPFLSIGRWWGKVTHNDEQGKPFTVAEEIDILATDRDARRYLVGECKFRNEPMDMAQWRALQEKVTWQGECFYYLFSLRGFSDAVRQAAAQSEHLRLVTLAEMVPE